MEIEREYHERFSRRLDRWLDEGYGECLLRNPHGAAAVAETLGRFDGDRYVNHSSVIMPNHVHVLFTLAEGRRLEKTLQEWKGVSANRVNKALERRGTLWQENYFDRIIRDGDHFWRCARYIRRNPKKARLRPGEFLLGESDAIRARLEECGE